MTASVFLGPGAKMSCSHCGTDFEPDEKTGNLVCTNPKCGKGGIFSSDRISFTDGRDKPPKPAS